MKVGVAAICCLAVKGSKFRLYEWSDRWSDADNLCQLAVLSTVSDSASFGDVLAALLADCQLPDWNYSENLCNEVISELFKDNDVDAPFNRANCDQVRGLVIEHWQHQASAQSLFQRAQRRQNLMAIEETASDKYCGKGYKRVRKSTAWNDWKCVKELNGYFSVCGQRGPCLVSTRKVLVSITEISVWNLFRRAIQRFAAVQGCSHFSDSASGSPKSAVHAEFDIVGLGFLNEQVSASKELLNNPSRTVRFMSPLSFQDGCHCLQKIIAVMEFRKAEL